MGVVATTATTALHAFCATGVGVSVNKVSKFWNVEALQKSVCSVCFFVRGRWDGWIGPVNGKGHVGMGI